MRGVCSRLAGDSSYRAFRLVLQSNLPSPPKANRIQCDAIALRREDPHVMSSPEAHTAAHAAKATDAAAPRSRFSRGKLLIGGVLSAVVLLAGGIFWVLSGPAKATPDELFLQALQKIDAKEFEAAADIAKPLQDAQFHPEAFLNGVAYILGMAAFHQAVAETDPASETRITQYAVAASFLREAGQADIPEERRPEWSFALGKSLLAGGELSAARPLLEDAYEHHPTQKAAVAKLVADLYLNPSWRSPELLEKALVLNTVALDGTTEPAERDFNSVAACRYSYRAR